MKTLKLATTIEGDDLELVFLALGPFLVGLRLTSLPKWLADFIRPSLDKD